MRWQGRIWASPLFAIMLVCAPAFLAVFKYARTGLNADILLNQIMAQQNITLFYWGQNRLLNLVPFMLAPLEWPLASLFALLFISTAAFFGALYLLALLTSRLFSGPSPNIANFAYIITLACLALLFKRAAWESYALWHFEYSLPACFVLINVLAWRRGRGPLFYLSFIPAFLAPGLNPSIFIIVFLALALKTAYSPAAWKFNLALLGVYALFFLFWIIASSAYGGMANYGGIEISTYSEGVYELVKNMFGEYLRAGVLLFLCCLAAGATLAEERLPSILNSGRRGRLNYLLAACFFIGALFTGWLACVPWVRMNNYNPRYLAFVVFTGILAFMARGMPAWWTRLARFSLAPLFCCVLFTATCYFFWPDSFNLARADVYLACDRATKPQSAFYAGDYWQIWACASRDLNHGFVSYPLGYRSSSNRENIANAMRLAMVNNGWIDAQCLNAAPEECERQIREHLPDYDLLAVESPGEKRHVLRLKARLD